MSGHTLLNPSWCIACSTLHQFDASGSNLHPTRNQYAHVPRIADAVVKLSNCGNIANYDRFWLCSLHSGRLALQESRDVFISKALLQSGSSICHQATAGRCL
jgi:hypothetical protein